MKTEGATGMSYTPLEEPLEPSTDAVADVRPTGLAFPAGGDRRPTAWARIRPLLLRLHFYAGIFIGPFVLMAALTGLLYALVPQIDAMAFRDELKVDDVGDRRLSLNDQVAAARAAHPEGTIASIRPPTALDDTTWVTLAVDDVPPDYARTVFVDPYTAQVRGTLTTYGQWMPVRAWFDELHRNLHLGAFGRNYSELAASWVWVIAIAGLLLWVGHRKGTRKLRRIALPDRGAQGLRGLLSWHGALGVWIIVVVLGLSVTGMTWSRFAGESVDKIQSHLSWNAPSVDTALSASAGPSGGGHHGAMTGAPGHSEVGADTALQAAESAGLRAPMWMYPPAAAEEGWQVSENKRDWPARHDSISIDPQTGAVTDRVNFADWPFMAKMTDWAIDAHMGILFGWVNQLLLTGVALALIASVVLGYRMWWRRRPTRGDRVHLPRPPRRGALRALRPYEALLAVLAVVGVGWFAPLFGASLAAFVAVDLVAGWWARRRRAP
ncbi:putative iron-regulated membrane protein [Mycolicibacterium rhodesiae NBB3]|uniref:Putative iron-regulated membrane protein n=2 Tax=Mycolicibacterium rhodesiae TaxID=36814 RepID=G8RLG6_MYCRN|nr:putative iron-regulated membrane protein [Mycolicibacterium rhodesiae NBB3]